MVFVKLSRKTALLAALVAGLMLALIPAANVVAFGPVRYHFAGKIDGEWPVQVELEIEGEKVLGRYWYEKVGARLDLDGTFANGQMQLTERTEDGVATGSWSGSFAPLMLTWSGKWTSADGSKSCPFELARVAEMVITEQTRLGFIRIRLSQPVFTGVAKHRGLQDVQAAVADEVWAAAATICEDPEDLLSDMEFDPEAPWWLWEHFSDVTVRHYSSSLISMVNEAYRYTGGAHGMTYYTTMNWVVGKNGATEFTIDQMFKKGTEWRKTISDYVIRDLRARGASSVVSGEVRDVSVESMNRFTVSPAGIDLIFGPYEMGCYAEGTWTVLVPWSACKGLIDPTGPVAAISE